MMFRAVAIDRDARRMAGNDLGDDSIRGRRNVERVTFFSRGVITSATRRLPKSKTL